MYIRKLLDDEYEKVIELLYVSVHEVCKNDYTEKELDAWAPKNFDVIKFRKALDGCYNIVVLEKDKIIGFLSMEENGYINRLYTHKDYLKKGIGSSLLKKAEAWAIEHDIYELTLDSSKTAEKFYLKMGFIEKGISVMEHSGVIFRNKTMYKKVHL